MKRYGKQAVALLIGAVLCAAGLAAWAYQLFAGMAVTGLRNSFTWGLYMASFEFFIALSTGGMLLYAVAYLGDVKTLKPFTRIAALASLASVVAAGVAIIEDLGEPFHILHMLIHPNFGSPLFWDVVILSLYVVLCVAAVIVELLPFSKKNGLSRRSLAIAEERGKRVAVIAVPGVILLNAVTALMFATQNTREWWHSALIPVNACAEAFAVGLAFMILVCILTTGEKQFLAWQDGLGLLAKIAAVSIAAYIFMTFLEIIPIAWSGTQESKHLLHLLFGTYGGATAAMLILPLIAMILFLIPGVGSKGILCAGSVLTMIGIFIQRMMLMYPAFNSIPLTLPVADKLWTYPIAVGTFTEGEDVFVRFWDYAPTAVEWIAGILPVGLIIFVLALGLLLFRLIPEETAA